MSGGYEVYRDPSVLRPEDGYEAPPPTPPAQWYVLVEYSNQGQAKPTTIVQVEPRAFASAEEAMGWAHQIAFQFRPRDPWSLQGRDVFRDGERGFVTVLRGATSTFHFSTRVVQWMGGVDH